MSRPLRSPFLLDPRSGVPVYRQLIDQVLAGIATGHWRPGAQLPTVRQLSVDLAINPNTVVRAYKELEIRGVLSTQQGTGTFIADHVVPVDQVERNRRLHQLAGEVAARSGAEGFSMEELIEVLREFGAEAPHKKDKPRR